MTNTWLWVTIILTSPFWMVLGIVIATLFVGLIAIICENIRKVLITFLELFKRKEKGDDRWTGTKKH